MKTIALLIVASVAVGTGADAQPATVDGNGAAQSQTSISADRRRATVANDSSAQAVVAAERSAGQTASADFAGEFEMNATLQRSIDARRANPGDEVSAETNEAFTTASGTTIPRGAKLVGRVTEARPYTRGAAQSQLGIVFEKAVLRDGREVPMNATIQAVAAAQSQAHGHVGSASHDPGAFGASGSSVAGRGLAAGPGGLAGGLTGSAGGAIGATTRLARPAVGAAGSGAAEAAARGGAVLGSSVSAVGGLSASGQWLAGSRGVFGLGDLSIASAAAGGAHGTLITSTSRNVRLDGGTQLLLVGNASASR